MSNNENPVIQVSGETIKQTLAVLHDAYEVIRAFYPGANWAERKGMKLMMDEMERLDETLRELMRPYDAKMEVPEMPE